MWDKHGLLNWFWQFLCEGLSSFNLKRFYYSYAWSCSLWEGRTCFSTGLNSRKLCRSLLKFSTGFIHSVSYFFFLYHLLCLYAQFLILIHLTSMSFSQPNHCNQLNSFVFGNFGDHHKDWLNYSGRADRPGDRPGIVFLSQKTLFRWLTFLLGPQTVISQSCFWIYFFTLMLVFVLKWLSSIGKSWSCCCLSFHWLSIKFTTRCPISSHSLWLSSCWLVLSSWSFEKCSMRGYL